MLSFTLKYGTQYLHLCHNTGKCATRPTAQRVPLRPRTQSYRSRGDSQTERLAAETRAGVRLSADVHTNTPDDSHSSHPVVKHISVWSSFAKLISNDRKYSKSMDKYYTLECIICLFFSLRTALYQTSALLYKFSAILKKIYIYLHATSFVGQASFS